MSETKNQKQKVYALFATGPRNEFGIEYHDDDAGSVFDLPWQTPHKEDMKIFRHLTKHNIVVMGRNTFESLGSKPLPNRINVVYSTDPPEVDEKSGVDHRSNLFHASSRDGIKRVLEFCATHFPDMDVFFIGGKMLLTEFFHGVANAEFEVDAVYHSEISKDWPQNKHRNLTSGICFFNPTDDVTKPIDFRNLNLTLDSQIVGCEKNNVISVRCTKWSNCRPKPFSMDTTDCLVFGKATEFYTPSKSQIKSNLVKLSEVSAETVAAISASLNPLVVETAINPTSKRDRGMSGIDPFDVTAAWRESVDEMDKYLNSSSKVLPQEKEPTESASEDNDASLPSDFVGVATEIGELLVIKDAAYGSAFEKTKEILKILFPSGLPVEAFDDGLTIQRILDKICRLTVLCTNPDENKTDERTEDAWKDIAGYAIKALCEQRRKKTQTS